ncbi:MAG: helix-turn-helix transcriptional regulator [Actinobacteria bacterium]|nr:helix-turn-helix transcriptional regulator [Actinomycetota bacterium]
MARQAADREKAGGTKPDILDHERFVREGPQKRFIEPRLLYLIGQSPSYGYQLIEDIGNLPFPGPIPDSAAVYRMLRELEKVGLVRSEWEHGESGPSKRVYYLTPQGEARLEVWVEAFKERVEMLNAFISLCEKAR